VGLDYSWIWGRFTVSDKGQVQVIGRSVGRDWILFHSWENNHDDDDNDNDNGNGNGYTVWDGCILSHKGLVLGAGQDYLRVLTPVYLGGAAISSNMGCCGFILSLEALVQELAQDRSGGAGPSGEMSPDEEADANLLSMVRHGESPLVACGAHVHTDVVNKALGRILSSGHAALGGYTTIGATR
jgi:hypothetical protein